MTPGTLSRLMTDESFAAVRAHPGFRTAVERATAESVSHFQHLAPSYQWITKDIGRASICVTALTLHLMGGLTVQALTAGCVEAKMSSAGRVQQVVRRCQDMGEMIVEPGAGMWTRRPMRLGDGLIRALRLRALIDYRAALQLAPELADAAELADTDEGFVNYLLCISIMVALRRDFFAFESSLPIAFFLDREAGMSILFDLIGAQSAERERLLEAARISRYALSRRYGVSRAHINKLLAESGHIDCVSSDRVLFSETLSSAMERHFSLVFHLNHCAAQALLSGWRFEPGRVRRAGV
jgi:hypothetical protein